MAPTPKRKRDIAPKEEDSTLSDIYMAILRSLGADIEQSLLTRERGQLVLAAAAAAFDPNNIARSGAAVRQAQIDAARAAGDLTNPESDVQGSGEWRWLDPYDRHLAFTRYGGLTQPRDTVQLRVDGTIPPSAGVNAEPFVVFVPTARYVDPAVRPSVSGRFEFLTLEADEHARLNFGDQEEFELDSHPSAESIWSLRQELRTRGRDDVTHDIQLVFIPAESAREPSPEAEASVSDTQDSVEIITDSATELLAPSSPDFTNGGKWDQTGDPEKAEHHRVYWPKSGKWLVTDRSRAIRGRPEGYMTECHGKS